MIDRFVLEVRPVHDVPTIHWEAVSRGSNGSNGPYFSDRYQETVIWQSAKFLRERWKKEQKIGQLILRGRNGRILWERTYGKDLSGSQG